MTVNDILRPGELLTSSAAAERLIAGGKSAVAARQHLARAAKKQSFWRSSRLQLARRERLIAERHAVGTVPFLRAAEELLREHRPGVARVLAALRQNQTVLVSDARKLLAVRGDEEFVRDNLALGDLGVLTDIDRGTALERMALSFAGGTRHSAQVRFQRLLAEAQIARAVVEHLRRHSILSWGGNTFSAGPTEPATFADYSFSACGWSWLAPVVVWNAGKASPSPVLVDVYAGECALFDVEGHIARLNRARAVTKRKTPLVGVIAARRFEKQALRTARNAGLMVINLLDVFGDPALELMTKVAALLHRTGQSLEAESSLDSNVGEISISLERLAEHPFVKDLRSLGLETLCALLARASGWEDVKVGTQVPFKEHSTREVDVFGVREGRRFLVVECKAHHSDRPLSPEDVKKFFQETVPAFVEQRQSWGVPVDECVAELWTTGRVDDAARVVLDQLPIRVGITRSLLDENAISTRIPLTMEPCRRLLSTIAAGT